MNPTTLQQQHTQSVTLLLSQPIHVERTSFPLRFLHFHSHHKIIKIRSERDTFQLMSQYRDVCINIKIWWETSVLTIHLLKCNLWDTCFIG